MNGRAWALSLGVLAASACGPDPQGPVPRPVLDPDDYAMFVAPIVGPTCAALECHGVDGRPLRIYAEDGLRLRADLRGEPLSADEAAWNADAFAGVDPEPESVDAHLALLKPLAVDAGGVAHVADDIWASRDVPELVCLRTWLAAEPVDATVCPAPPEP